MQTPARCGCTFSATAPPPLASQDPSREYWRTLRLWHPWVGCEQQCTAVGVAQPGCTLARPQSSRTQPRSHAAWCTMACSCPSWQATVCCLRSRTARWCSSPQWCSCWRPQRAQMTQHAAALPPTIQHQTRSHDGCAPRRQGQASPGCCGPQAVQGGSHGRPSFRVSGGASARLQGCELLERRALHVEQSRNPSLQLYVLRSTPRIWRCTCGCPSFNDSSFTTLGNLDFHPAGNCGRTRWRPGQTAVPCPQQPQL